MAIWRTFLKILNLLDRAWGSPLQIIMAVWRASKYYLQQAVTPDQPTQQNSL
jgi:hypothetical protein